MILLKSILECMTPRIKTNKQKQNFAYDRGQP